MDKDSVLTLDEVKIAPDEVSISLDEVNISSDCLILCK
jgi:hypothetical protein